MLLLLHRGALLLTAVARVTDPEGSAGAGLLLIVWGGDSDGDSDGDSAMAGRAAETDLRLATGDLRVTAGVVGP